MNKSVRVTLIGLGAAVATWLSIAGGAILVIKYSGRKDRIARMEAGEVVS